MAKFRKRVNMKGKRWKKGQSSSSNPSTQKYREAAQSRFFCPIEGESNLTQDALQKHNAFVGGDIEETNDEELESFGSKTCKTFDTFASDWSCVSNQSFSSLIRKFRSDSDMHKNMLAVLAAITEIIKEKGGTESSTEYFAALMTSLNSTENDVDSTAAILNLLSMCIKSTPQSVLQIKFSDASSTLINLLAQYSQSEKVPIIRALLGCLSVLLRAQEAAVWNAPSTLQILDSILTFITFSKPKIRKAAQYGITVIVRDSKITPNALGHIANYCIRLTESVTTGAITTTLHILTLMKEIMHKFPRNELKESCETVLKVMTMKNILLTSCGMQALHGMLVNQPTSNCLPAHRNARLISALYNYQPPSDDTQPMQAWLVTMQQAYINLARIDLSLCMANVVKLFRQLTELYHGQRADIMTAVTYCLQAVMTECVAPAASVKPKFNQPIAEIANILEELLTEKIGTALPHVLHVLSAFFKECGEHCPQILTPCLKSVAELRDDTEFTYKSELENTVGSAVRAMGPQIIIDTVPFKIVPGDRQFKRSWLLPVLKDNIKNSTLKCFIDRFLPIAAVCRNEGDRLRKLNDQIGVISYDLLQSQIWSLLPSFSAHPSDISSSFGSFAKTLGGLLNSRKDLRLIILASLRKLITHSLETDNREDILTMSKFAKNYLPLLFNIYTTKVTGSDEEGARLASLETIKVYLKISEKELTKELFDKALDKVENKETEEFIKESVMDLLRALLPYQNQQDIGKLYTQIIEKIKDIDNQKEQKKYYRLLEEILTSNSESCVQFFNENIDHINELVLGSFDKSATSSKGARLRCLFELIKRTENPSSSILDTILPETILCVKDINNRCRETAFQILGYIAKNLDVKDYLHIVIAGLAGNPTMISCSLLGLAAIVYYINKTLEPSLEEQLLYNVGLLAVCNSREIATTALSFIKVYLTTFPREKIYKYLPQLIKVLSNMTEDCKRHSRIKTRDILSRLVRWFGGETLLKLVPNKDETLRIRIRNLAKIQVRRQKKRESDRQSRATTEISTFTIGNKQKSIEEILNESDSDEPLDDDEEEEEEKPKKKNKQKTWIAENADDIVDFTDIRASHKITGTKPGSNFEIPTIKKSKTKTEFNTAPDGRLIIIDDKSQDMDDDDDDEDFTNKKKKKKKQVIPGLEDFDDDYEPSDDDDILTNTTSAGLGLKRALSVSTLNSTAHTNKYRAGGTGIHRPLKQEVSKKGKSKKSRNFTVNTGTEYRATKAKGDIKKKGKPDPYAYLPLRRDALNKRKRMKNMAQVKNILKAAKTGAKIGSKLKMKRK